MGIKQHLATALVTSLLATPAHASKLPYTECNMPAGEEIIIWKLALDETPQTVSWEHSLISGTKRATFTNDKVTEKRGRFQISRVTFQFTRESFLGGGKGTGQCEIVDPPSRAF